MRSTALAIFLCLVPGFRLVACVAFVLGLSAALSASSASAPTAVAPEATGGAHRIAVGPENPRAAAFFREQVWPLFKTRCLECHAQAKAKGGLSMEHLEGLLVGGDTGPALVPGDATASAMIQAVRALPGVAKMPPKTPLTAAEIAVLVRWVEIGAPWPALRDAGPTTAAGATSGHSAAAGTAPARPPLLGRLHPIIVHMPIACLMLVLLSELLTAALGPAFRATTGLLLVVGTLSALAAAISGTLLEGNQDPALLSSHQLAGWLVLALAMTALVLFRLVPRHPRLVLPYRLCLLITAALTAWAGHLGGTMVHGAVF